MFIFYASSIAHLKNYVSFQYLVLKREHVIPVSIVRPAYAMYILNFFLYYINYYHHYRKNCLILCFSWMFWFEITCETKNNQYTKGCGDPDGLGSYNTYNVGTWSFHLFVFFQLLIQLLQVQFRYRLKIPKQPEQDSGIHLKTRYSRQAEGDQSCTGIIIT